MSPTYNVQMNVPAPLSYLSTFRNVDYLLCCSFSLQAHLASHLLLEGFTPQPAKPPNRSPCFNSTDTKFDNIFLRIELCILYVSKGLVRNLLSNFAWLVNCRALQIFAAGTPRRALALNPGAEISTNSGRQPFEAGRLGAFGG